MDVVADAQRVEARAPAKINLFLEVLHHRPDGFHEIDTVFQSVSLYDRLRCTPGPALELAVRPRVDGVPEDDANLALRAARRLAQRAGSPGGARIELTKGIPVGAGLGGGSSDAAAALVALQKLWEAAPSHQDVRVVAGEVGSDVPFFLGGGTARGRGRGERLSPIQTSATLWYAILWPGVAASTADVYRGLDLRPDHQPRAPDALIAALEAGDTHAIAAAAFNRLEPVAAAMYPEVNRALDRMRATRALTSHVTGSGSAVFGLFETEASAGRAAEELRRTNEGQVWVAHTEPASRNSP